MLTADWARSSCKSTVSALGSDAEETRVQWVGSNAAVALVIHFEMMLVIERRRR